MIKTSEIRQSFRQISKSLLISQKTFDAMTMVIHSTLVLSRDVKPHQLDGMIPAGPIRDTCLVKPLGAKTSVLMRHETGVRISAHAWQNEEIQLAAHIVDCLWVGASTVFSKLGDGEWDIVPTFLLALSWVLEDSWVKELKFHLCTLFCLYAGQDEPESIDSIHRPGTLFLGPLARRIKQKITRGNAKSWIFLNTLINGFKKGLPRVAPSTVKSSAFKHKERLSREGITPDFILEKVRETGMAIFRPDTNSRADQFNWSAERSSEANLGVCLREPQETYVPSTHACTDVGRKDLGSLGALLRDNAMCHENFEVVEEHVLTPDQLVFIFYHPRHAPMGYEVRSVYVYSDMMRNARWENLNPYHFFTRDGLLMKVRRDKSLLWTQTMAHVKFILEPLKVRPITAMGWRHNSMYPEIQQGMWQCLQKFRQFSLTGRTVDKSDISWVVNKTRRLFPSWFQSDWDAARLLFNSGDFSGATDSCHMDLSTTLIDTVSKDPFVRELLRFNLSEQKISYGFSKLKDHPETFRMTNGQLMGSRFSFPLLCVFNLAIYWECLEELFGPCKLEDLPVLVNGDDILFMGPRVLLDLWSIRIKQAGLEKSVGKNYESNSFCTINSQLFTTQVFAEDQIIENVPYLNMGLCFGVKKEPFSGEGGGERHEKQKSRFKCLRGAFSVVQDLPKEMATSFEEQIRGHRPDIGKSFLPRSILGFSPERDIPTGVDTIVREELLRELCYGPEDAPEFMLGVERNLQTHFGLHADAETERDPGRARKQVYKHYGDWSVGKLRFELCRRRFWTEVRRDRSSGAERAIRGLPERKVEKESSGNWFDARGGPQTWFKTGEGWRDCSGFYQAENQEIKFFSADLNYRDRQASCWLL
jgi:hypothetical protein